MKNTKRTLALVLCVLAMVTAFAMSFADNAHVSSKISANEVKVGETVTVTVSMKNTTVSSLGVTVAPSSSFEVVSGTWLQNGTIANFDTAKNKGAFAPGSATAISGDIFKVTLKAKSAGANAQEIKVTVVGKTGTETVFNESTSKSAKILCSIHVFGAWSQGESKHERTCANCGFKESVNHTWDKGVVTKQPTCTATGIKTFTCTDCKQTKTESVAKLKHTYGDWTNVDAKQHARTCTCGASEKKDHNWNAGKVVTDATCSKEGSKLFTCTDCKATKTETITKKDHAYTNTCDTDCNKCGATRNTGHKFESKWTTDSKNHWHKCSVCGDVKDKASHTVSDWIVDKEATETTAGKKHKECTLCKTVVEKDTIPAKGCKHTAGTTISGKSDATCEKNGSTGDEVCTTCKTVMKKGEVIEALGHDIELQNTKEGTCQDDGYTGDEYCKRCKTILKQGEVITKGEHNVEVTDAKEATCIAEGFTGKQICKTCNEVVDEGTVIPMTEHEYVDGTCKNCSEIDPNYVAPTEPTTTPTEPTEPTDPNPNEPKNNTIVWILVGCGVAVAVAAGIIIFIVSKRKDEEKTEE